MTILWITIRIIMSVVLYPLTPSQEISVINFKLCFVVTSRAKTSSNTENVTRHDKYIDRVVCAGQRHNVDPGIDDKIQIAQITFVICQQVGVQRFLFPKKNMIPYHPLL